MAIKSAQELQLSDTDVANLYSETSAFIRDELEPGSMQMKPKDVDLRQKAEVCAQSLKTLGRYSRIKPQHIANIRAYARELKESQIPCPTWIEDYFQNPAPYLILQ